MKLLKLSALVISLVSIKAFAAGDAGCGLGSMVFSENKKGHQILAATTNGTFGSQTFGITTGTSNCSADGFVMNEKQIQHFAEANQSDLTREMAQGKGEKLATLASMYGCKGNSVEAFGKMTQQSYSDIVNHSDINASEMIKNINEKIASDKSLVKACLM